MNETYQTTKIARYLCLSKTNDVFKNYPN